MLAYILELDVCQNWTLVVGEALDEHAKGGQIDDGGSGLELVQRFSDVSPDRPHTSHRNDFVDSKNCRLLHPHSSMNQTCPRQRTHPSNVLVQHC